MAGWFFDKVVDKLFDTGFDYFQDQYFRGRTGMEGELERLRENQPLIQAVVSAYNQGNITDRNLNSWLWKLRDAIDEANDVLDDFEYMKHEEQLELNMEETKVRSSFTGSFFGLALKLFKVDERGLKIDPNLELLKETVQKLDRVSAQANSFFHLLEKKEKEQQVYADRASGSLPGPVFIGRHQEKEIAMQWLRKPSNHNLSLLSIVGHGGMGKTTLLQNIFADEIANEFDLKIWVRISNGFEVEEVIMNMLSNLGKFFRSTELSCLQSELQFVTQYQKFLLVLDDIWEENTTKWEKVISPLAKGKLGSKILVTTRTDAAASMIPDMIIKNKETLRLKGLGDAQCLELLKTHAFAGMENFSEYKKLMCIAEKIVEKLSGSPLATKVIGGVLKYDLTPKHWERVLMSNIGSFELIPGQNTNTIMPILRLSYALLPEPLQNCFTFCSIFPQGHQFDKDDLVRMWISLGFIQESSTEEDTLEDIGGRYFDVLVRNSFFDDFQSYYKMHDLLHDLAQSISSEECFRFVGNNVLSFKIPKNVRHLFVKTGNPEVLKMIKDVKNLHSLFLTDTTYDQCFTEILSEIFKASRSIRLLFIFSRTQTNMTEDIKNLRHLRYLKLHVDLTQMPRSLSSLYHLRYIIYEAVVDGSYSHDFLPGDVSNLFNLRHLGLAPEVISSVPGIGKLRSLQELYEFNVRNWNGYRIGELEHMSELRKLKINFLEIVMNATEARYAKLYEKRKLTNLFLNWGKTGPRKIVNSDLDVNVLENLKPCKNLKKLSILSYMGVSSAEWMYNADLISNLEYISLDGCSQWETLPPFGQLPHLKSLYLRNMPKAKRLDYKFHGIDNVSVFPSLEVLYMEGLEVLKDWFDGEGAAEYDCFFPCLTELFLKNCPNLQELLYLPHKLKKMEIHRIGWKTLNCEQGGTSKSIPLETLEVISCPNISSLLLADVRLEALRKLRIERCRNLISLGGLQQVENGIEKFQLIVSEVIIDDLSLLLTVNIASLKKLTICNNDLLRSFTIEAEQWFQHVSSSLRELSFRNFKSLQSLPSSLKSHSSLEILHVEKVSQLQQLLHIPASLKELHLRSLHELHLPTSLSAISSLKNLQLYRIPLLKSMPDLPSSLDSIKVECCDNLQCLPSSLSAISSLIRLDLDSIPLLKSLPDLPSSLGSITIKNCYNLQCLPSSFSAISSLHDLWLHKIPLLKSLPDLPSSLISITVMNCHPELRERYEKISGSDWHKIAHIPDVCIC